jgi:serine/threonine-protein kinase
MPPDALIPIVVAVADALAALHTAGLVHRDVKPSNILFTADRVKLGDFGLVQSGSRSGELTEPGTAVGTLAYLAPERLRGERGGPPSDVHALATVTHLGLTGSLPRPTGSVSDVVAASAFRAPSVSSVRPAIGPAFDEAVLHGMAVEPARRPDPLAFAAELTTALGVWTRAGRPGRDDVGRDAASAAAGTGLAGTGPDGDEPTTAIALPLDETASIAVEPSGSVPPIAPIGDRDRVDRPTDDRGETRRSSIGIALVLLALAAVAVVAALAIMGSARSVAPGAGGTSPVTPSRPASAGPLPSAAASPSTTPTADPALTALDAVDRAIAAARGGPDGLKGKDANELEDLAGRVRRDLLGGDRSAALDAARALDRKIRDVARHLGKDAADRLRSASTALLGALGA